MSRKSQYLLSAVSLFLLLLLLLVPMSAIDHYMYSDTYFVAKLFANIIGAILIILS